MVPELHRVSGPVPRPGRGLYRQWGISPRPEDIGFSCPDLIIYRTDTECKQNFSPSARPPARGSLLADAVVPDDVVPVLQNVLLIGRLKGAAVVDDIGPAAAAARLFVMNASPFPVWDRAGGPALPRVSAAFAKIQCSTDGGAVQAAGGRRAGLSGGRFGTI